MEKGKPVKKPPRWPQLSTPLLLVEISNKARTTVRKVTMTTRQVKQHLICFVDSMAIQFTTKNPRRPPAIPDKLVLAPIH